MKRIVICFDGTWNKPAEETLPADPRVEPTCADFIIQQADLKIS